MNLPESIKPLSILADNLVKASTVATTRQCFEEMESELLKLPQLPAEAYQLEEYVSGGLYCRKIILPKGSLVTGRVHKFDHMEFMLFGDISIVSANGVKSNYQGFHAIEAKAGKRQTLYAHEDTCWMTVCRVPNIPLAEMFEYCSVANFEEFDAYHRKMNQADYVAMLNQWGISQADMDLLANADDVIEIDSINLYVGESSLHGKGLFPKRDIREGEMIMPSRIGDKRTIASRYANHALFPNSIPVLRDGEVYLQAMRDIPANEEITVNYRDVMGFTNQKIIDDELSGSGSLA